MRVLLVTNGQLLAGKLDPLNPELEFCGIVVDDVENSKKTLADCGLSQDLLYPMSELKACVERLPYDYVLCVQNRFYDKFIRKILSEYQGLSTEKMLSFAELPKQGNFITERRLRYYQEQAQDFEIFATGISTTEAGLDIRKFKYKAINFAESSQDLYYNFQIAKSIMLYRGGIVRFVMLSSGWHHILFTTIFPRHLYSKVAYCLISSLSMIYIISLYLWIRIKSSFARSGC
ncbi:MAG: hypothetical protein SR1Q5_03350 [Quinella sp. 1Q5]|nr:hypothetical protein [Quinella sp. 1Q5]